MSASLGIWNFGSAVIEHLQGENGITRQVAYCGSCFGIVGALELGLSISRRRDGSFSAGGKTRPNGVHAIYFWLFHRIFSIYQSKNTHFWRARRCATSHCWITGWNEFFASSLGLGPVFALCIYICMDLYWIHNSSFHSLNWSLIHSWDGLFHCIALSSLPLPSLLASFLLYLCLPS